MNEWLSETGSTIIAWASRLLDSLQPAAVGTLALVAGLLLLGLVCFGIWRRRSINHLKQKNLRLQLDLLGANERNAAQGDSLLEKDSQLSVLRSEVANARPFESRFAASEAQAESLRVQLVNEKQVLASLREELNLLRVESTERESSLKEQRRAMQEKLDQLEQIKQQLGTEFQNLANRIFDEKNQRFSRHSQELLNSTLSPLKTQLEDFRKKVEDTYSTEAKERHLLKSEIDKLREESVRISEDASNLTRALKHDNKAQGNWGELSLQRALEMCGLKEGVEFHTQVVVNAEGGRQIPDVVVHLPGAKDIVIDSKMSLLAYTRYFECEEEAQRQAALDEHIASIRAHVRDLSKKNYSSLLGINSLDYVMLYIPVEGASMMALQAEPDLWNFAYSRNIVLVGPSNLLAVLRSVETIWRHERQNKNAEKIADEAGKLHDQFARFAESLEEVGKQLSRASEAYEKATERLSTGRGNLVRRVENLQKLGAKTQKSIPDDLKSRAGLDSESDEQVAALELVSEAQADTDTEIEHSSD